MGRQYGCQLVDGGQLAGGLAIIQCRHDKLDSVLAVLEHSPSQYPRELVGLWKKLQRVSFHVSLKSCHGTAVAMSVHREVTFGRVPPYTMQQLLCLIAPNSSALSKLKVPSEVRQAALLCPMLVFQARRRYSLVASLSLG